MFIFRLNIFNSQIILYYILFNYNNNNNDNNNNNNNNYNFK